MNDTKETKGKSKDRVAKSWTTFKGVAVPADPKVLVSLILTSRLDMKYWSSTALRDLYVESINMAVRMAEDMKENLPKERQFSGKRANLTRFINSAPRRLKYIPRTREKLLKKIYEEVMRCEGLGPLRGFGIGNIFGDTLVGDPERQSLYEIKRKGKSNKEGILTMNLTTEQLDKIGQELQELLQIVEPDTFDPAASDENKLDWIKEAGAMATPEEITSMSDETSKTLEGLGIGTLAEDEAEAKIPSESEKETAEASAEASEKEQPTIAKSRNDKKKKEKPKKEKPINRWQAIAEIMNSGETNFAEITEKADSLFASRRRCAGNMREAKTTFRLVRLILEAFGFAEVDTKAETIKLKK